MPNTIIQYIVAAVLSAGVTVFVMQRANESTNTPVIKTITPSSAETTAINSNQSEQQQRIQQLQQELAAEQQSREALEYELQLLEDLLADANTHDNTNEPTDKPQKSQELWFDEQRLIDLGTSATEIETIKQLHNRAELEKLELRTQRLWTKSP